ncbi:MAG: ParA family protein [Terriglobales bacterium]
MPTIVFVSPKGGAGKTTAALLLASQLAASYDVTLIDADPNRPIKAWASGGNTPKRLSVVSDVDEDNIIERIEEAAQKSPIVVVDLEGTAAKIVVLAVSQADLAVIPIQGSQLDAEQASRAIKVIKQREKMTGRALPYAVLLTRTNPVIRTRTMSHIQKGLIDAGVPVMETELNDREAFRAVFSFRQPLAGLDPTEVANLDKAQANVEDFALEILRGLSSTSSEVRQGEVA